MNRRQLIKAAAAALCAPVLAKAAGATPVAAEPAVDSNFALARAQFLAEMQKVEWERGLVTRDEVLDRTFFEGDDLTDPREMVGLRARLLGNEIVLPEPGLYEISYSGLSPGRYHLSPGPSTLRLEAGRYRMYADQVRVTRISD